MVLKETLEEHRSHKCHCCENHEWLKAHRQVHRNPSNSDAWGAVPALFRSRPRILSETRVPSMKKNIAC